jgi:hypothetical protein
VARKSEIRLEAAAALEALLGASKAPDDAQAQRLLRECFEHLAQASGILPAGRSLREVAAQRHTVAAGGLLSRMNIDPADIGLREAGRASDASFEYRGGSPKPPRTRMPAELDEGRVTSADLATAKTTKRSRKAGKDGRLPPVDSLEELARQIERAGPNPSEKVADHLVGEAHRLGAPDAIPDGWPRSRKAREAVRYAAGATAVNPRARGGLLERVCGPDARDHLGR